MNWVQLARWTSASKLLVCVNGRMDGGLSVGVTWCFHFKSMKDNEIWLSENGPVGGMEFMEWNGFILRSWVCSDDAFHTCTDVFCSKVDTQTQKIGDMRMFARSLYVHPLILVNKGLTDAKTFQSFHSVVSD